MSSFQSYIEKLARKIEEHSIPEGTNLGPFGTFKKLDVEGLKTKGAREAAVLILLHPMHEAWHIALIQRPVYEGVHGGQIAFPGGKLEKGESYKAAAYRETQEEIGVNSDLLHHIGDLDPIFIPPSQFIVYPFVAFADKQLSFTKEEAEVDEILHFPLDALDFKHSQRTEVFARNQVFNVPVFPLNDKVIWGATARILAEFCYYHQLLKHQ